MGIFLYYLFDNHNLLVNNDYTYKIYDFELKANIQLLKFIDKMEETLCIYLNNNIDNLNEDISNIICNDMNSIILNMLYNEYLIIINIPFINMLSYVISKSIMNNYKSQIEIVRLIMDYNNVSRNYKFFIKNNLIKISVRNSLNNLNYLYDMIIKKQIKKNVATFCIQKNFRYCNTNPEYNLCRSRLLKDFNNMQNIQNQNL
jgi:hypothetical protein